MGGQTSPMQRARLTYRRVAAMNGQELLDGLEQPQLSGIHTLMRAEIRLRLVLGLKRKPY